MRFVGEQGVSVADLWRLARTKTNLNGMERWGYVTVSPKPPRRTSVIRATAAGQKAQAVWRPLPEEIESRWRERFGGAEIDRLREALAGVVSRLDVALPDCLPILGYGLTATYTSTEREERDCSRLSLLSLVSKLLMSFALEFDRVSTVSLAITANVLRVIGDAGVRVRDLPQLSGVSKESIAMALSFLGKRGCAVVGASAGVKGVSLTAKGRHARDQYDTLLRVVETRWDLRDLRLALEPFSAEALLRGLVPYPDGWRASVARPHTLPFYPMVLHRGGYPDGS